MTMTITEGESAFVAGAPGLGSAVDQTAVTHLLGPTVNQLFAATLELSSIATVSEIEIASRLDQVIRSVDSAIRQLRNDLVEQHSGRLQP